MVVVAVVVAVAEAILGVGKKSDSCGKYRPTSDKQTKRKKVPSHQNYLF